VSRRLLLLAALAALAGCGKKGKLRRKDETEESGKK
jgi:predicted small lipoprotein YifL